MVLSEIFWISFVGTASGLLIKLASMLFKSKCSECSFCGVYVKRDVVLEEKENEFEILNKQKSRRHFLCLEEPLPLW